MLEYAYDIRSYFKFIAAGNPLINSYHDVTLDILDKMTPRDIQEYMSYLRSHKDESGRIVTNDANARARKLSSLRSFYQYYLHLQVCIPIRLSLSVHLSYIRKNSPGLIPKKSKSFLQMSLQSAHWMIIKDLMQYVQIYAIQP